MNCDTFRLVKPMRSAAFTWAGRASLVATFVFVPALWAQDQSPGLPVFEVTSVKPDTFVPAPGHGRVPEVSCSNGRPGNLPTGICSAPCQAVGVLLLTMGV